MFRYIPTEALLLTGAQGALYKYDIASGTVTNISPVSGSTSILVLSLPSLE